MSHKVVIWLNTGTVFLYNTKNIHTYYYTLGLIKIFKVPCQCYCVLLLSVKNCDNDSEA